VSLHEPGGLACFHGQSAYGEPTRRDEREEAWGRHASRCEYLFTAAGASSPCREPAHWFVHESGVGEHGGRYACEEHCKQALMEGSCEVTGADDDEPVALERGEIARVA
jgi:hypothetical protein